MNARVREMIKNALQSEGVEEVVKLGNEDNESNEIDIFDEDYINKVNNLKLPNTKIKLLQNLLSRAIESIKKINKIQGVDFSNKMEKLVEKYNDRDKNDILNSEIFEEIADELTRLIYEIQEEFFAGEELGISYEEKAFYDILKSLCVKYNFTYPEDKLITLATEVKELVDNKAKFVGWNERENIKAGLKVDLILLLDKFGYPPVERDEVYYEIFEQAENFKKNNG